MAAIHSPFYLSDRALRASLGRAGTNIHGILIDVGCGTRPYEYLFPKATYIGVEVPAASTVGSAKRPHVLYDGHHLPISDSSVQSVLCSQVLEHVFSPDQFLHEIWRILEDSGTLILTVPFMWDEHEQPFDYARYSSFGLRHLLERHSFSVVSSTKTLANASVLFQLTLAYLFKVARCRQSTMGRAIVAALSIPLNLLGLLAQISTPSNQDMYLDNVMVLRKITNPE